RRPTPGGRRRSPRTGLLYPAQTPAASGVTGVTAEDDSLKAGGLRLSVQGSACPVVKTVHAQRSTPNAQRRTPNAQHHSICPAIVVSGFSKSRLCTAIIV